MQSILIIKEDCNNIYDVSDDELIKKLHNCERKEIVYAVIKLQRKI